jgi:hypothetical protein
VAASFQPASAIGFDLSQVGVLPFEVSVAARFLEPGGAAGFGPQHLITQPGFLGFVGTEGTQIIGLTFTPNQMGGFGGPGGSFAAIDNVAMTVPEPASLLLFAMGAAAVAARRRRSRSTEL